MSLNPNAQKWVEALRSGKYQQGFQKLCTAEEKYCCLGVLCEVAIQEGVISSYIRTDPYLPEEVQTWVGLQSSRGDYKIKHSDFNVESRNLADIDNDRNRSSFTIIADIIESQPTGLFKE